MEQITREEIIGLLRNFQQRMAAKRGMCDEPDGALWDSAEAVIAALQAAEPVAWQFYEDGEWHSGDRKIAGYRRNTEAAGIPVRDLFALPCLPATELAPESWREELETIAEILEADGDEWNCSARIRKILKPPTKAQVPEWWEHLAKTKPEMEPFRSSGCVNSDYDMAKISINLPIIEAKKLMTMLTASPNPVHSDEKQQEEAEQPPLQLPDFCTDPDDSDEVASLWDHGFKRGWDSCLGAVAKAMQPAEQQPAPDASESKATTPKESWRAGYRAGKGLPANTPRQDAIAAPDVAKLVEALKACRDELRWMIERHNHQNQNDGSWLYDYQTVEEAHAALAAYRKQGGEA